MFAAFHLPDLPVAAALQARPDGRAHPCAVLREPTDKEDGKIPLLALNAAAWSTGIAPGWPLNRALVRCPDLRVLPRQPQVEAALLAELVAFANRFSADLEITSPDTVTLDLAGTKRVHFHGMECLPESEAEVRHALADTPDLAGFAVREPRTCGRFISTAEIGTLPLALLSRLDEKGAFLPLLELLGLRTLADFCGLPRQGLAERFGPLAGHWQDLVSGKTRRLLKLHRPPDSLAQAIDFDDAIHSSEALVFVFNRLLHALSARLAARHLAASVLEIRFLLETGEMRREIHLPEPLADPAALLRPIQTLVESLVLPSPVAGISLDALAAFPFSRQSDWTKRQLPDPARWADTLARLEALVGSGRVGIPVPLEIHRPDAFGVRSAVDGGEISPAAAVPPACSIPLRRSRPPVEISVASEAAPCRHPRPLALLTGPHRGPVLETRGPFPASGNYWNPAEIWSRVEWDVRVDQAPMLRLAYQPDGRWQLDGTYF